MSIRKTEEQLQPWLEWLEAMQPDRIELALDRVVEVSARAALERPSFRVITVAGTNGKGTTVAYAARLLRYCGCLLYTSPSPRDS